MTFEEFIDSPEAAQFVGANAESYRTRWKAMYAKAGSVQKMDSAASWNWAAFLFGPAWLAYRQMHKLMAIFIIVIVAMSIAEEFVGQAIDYALLGVFLVTGLYGNAFYFRHTFNHVSEAGNTGATAQGAGGVNWPAAIGTPIVGIIAILLVGYLPTYVGTVRGTLLGGATTQESDILEDLSGVWRMASEPIMDEAKREVAITLKLGGENKFIALNGGERSPITVVDIDEDSGIVTVRETATPGQDVSSFRQIWDKERESFTLLMTAPGGRQAPLSYVRRLTDADMPPAAVAHVAVKPTPATAQPSAPGPAISGIYKAKGDAFGGELTVIKLDENTYSAKINTVGTDGNFPVCEIAEDSFAVEPYRGDGSTVTGITFKEKDGSCTVSVSVIANFAEVRAKGDSCRQYCGQGGDFEGIYSK